MLFNRLVFVEFTIPWRESHVSCCAYLVGLLVSISKLPSILLSLYHMQTNFFFTSQALFALAPFQQSLYPFSFLQTCWDFIRLFSKFHYWICRGCTGYFSIHMLCNDDQDGRCWPFLPIYVSSCGEGKMSQYFHEESQEFFAYHHRIWQPTLVSFSCLL